MFLIYVFLPPIFFAVLAAQSSGRLFLGVKRLRSGALETVLFISCMVGLLRSNWSQKVLEAYVNSHQANKFEVTTGYLSALGAVCFPLIAAVLLFELIRVVLQRSISSSFAPVFTAIRPVCLMAFYLAAFHIGFSGEAFRNG